MTKQQQSTKPQQGTTESSPPLTMSVPAAGKKYFGLSRNASYDAANRGDIPTIQVGKLRRAIVGKLDKMLDQ